MNMGDDWNCNYCEGSLCTGCGFCPTCEGCRCGSRVNGLRGKFLARFFSLIVSILPG